MSAILFMVRPCCGPLQLKIESVPISGDLKIYGDLKGAIVPLPSQTIVIPKQEILINTEWNKQTGDLCSRRVYGRGRSRTGSEEIQGLNSQKLSST